MDPRYPEKPGNLVFGAHSDLRAIQSLVRRAAIDGAHLWPQLGHAGALSHPPISPPKGPSALNIDGLQCAGMSVEDIHELPDMYARTAAFAKGRRIWRRSCSRRARVSAQSIPVSVVQPP